MIFLEGNLALLRHFCNFAVTYEIFIYLNSAQHPKNQSCCETGLVYFVHLLQNSSFAIQFHLFFQLTEGLVKEKVIVLYDYLIQVADFIPIHRQVLYHCK